MARGLNAIPLQFWRSAGGNEPVREWLKELPAADRIVIGGDLRRLQFGWPIGMPLVRSLKEGMWEMKATLPTRREARLLFAVDEGGILVLHGFIKKTQRAPPAEIALARKRLKDMLI